MKYIENYTVTSHEVDTNNQIRPHMVLRFMQETADHQMRDRHPTFQELFFEKGKTFILTRFSVEITGHIGMYDNISVRTWQSDRNGKGLSFIRCYEIINRGEIVARGHALWAMVEIATKRICKVMEEDFSGYEAEAPLNLNIPVRFRLPRTLNFSEVEGKTVHYSDCDMNMHLNNTNYGRMVCDRLPEAENKQITSINLHFRTEAPLGEEVRIELAEMGVGEEDKQWFKEYGDKEADKLYFFKSYVSKGINMEAVVGTRERKKV